MVRNLTVAVLVAGWAAAAVAGSDERGLVISTADCAALTEHRPDPSVEYTPGVDVAGRAVAPADLPEHEPLHLDAGDVAIDPRIPLDRYFELPRALASILGDAEIGVGLVTVRDGVAYLGDRPLGDPAQAAIAEACTSLREPLR
jgi:hypothetical protein